MTYYMAEILYNCICINWWYITYSGYNNCRVIGWRNRVELGTKRIIRVRSQIDTSYNII